MMRLDVTLEDETRKVIATLSNALIIESKADLESFKLLRYLDAYGDTVFNRFQIDDLITDLKRLDKLVASPTIGQVLELAERCKDEVHTYLCFNGD